MSGDLVAGGYPVIDPFTALGNSVNAAQGNLAARSNLKYGILGSLQDAAAALTTADMVLVPVPVCGDEFSTVTVLVGATAASTPTHSWAQLYSGTLTTATALTTQSTDGTTTAIAASTALSFTLGKKYIIQPGDAPFGYIYVGLGLTASTVPSLISGTVPTACQKTWFTNTPLLAANISAAGASAPATVTLASTTAQAAVPVVYLT
jgi:hypothetical protein